MSNSWFCTALSVVTPNLTYSYLSFPDLSSCNLLRSAEMLVMLCLCLARKPVSGSREEAGDFLVGGTVGTVGTPSSPSFFLSGWEAAGTGAAVDTGTMCTAGLNFLSFLIGFLTLDTVGRDVVEVVEVVVVAVVAVVVVVEDLSALTASNSSSLGIFLTLVPVAPMFCLCLCRTFTTGLGLNVIGDEGLVPAKTALERDGAAGTEAGRRVGLDRVNRRWPKLDSVGGALCCCSTGVTAGTGCC